MPKVAIITPVYNAAAYVEQTIRSVLAQTFEDWSLTLIDDGSTDDSLAICQKFAVDPRIKIVTQRNAGVASARNCGIAQAGPVAFYTFLDSDDLLHPRFLENALRYMESHPELQLVRGVFDRIDDEGRRWNRLLDLRVWNHKRLVWRLFENDLGRLFLLLGTFPPVGVLVRADAVKNELWFKESLFGTEDSELWTRLALRGAQMRISGFKGGSYRIRKASISTDIGKRSDNYQKWINHSLASEEAQNMPSDFPQLISALRELQLSGGLTGAARSGQAAKGMELLRSLDISQFDKAVQHVIYNALVNAELEEFDTFLPAMGASEATVMAARVLRLAKARPRGYNLLKLVGTFICAPFCLTRGLFQLFGWLPAERSS